MGNDNLVFLEVIEWFDETGQELVHRIPEKGSGEIKYGAQLTVRESQAAVFFYQGRAIEAFGPGRHTLKTANIPILTKLISIPWGMTSPLRAEVYLLNMKIFTDLKWGTRDPVAFRDSQLGLIRLRAHGIFNVQIVQPVLFINSLVGTRGMFTTEEIAGYLNTVIVSRFNDFMGDNLETLLDLPARYDEFSKGLSKRLEADLSRFGLALTHLYINSITPPPEVQQAIDDRSRMGVFQDLDRLMKMKAAMAMEKASEGSGEGGSAMGTSLGLMMPAMFAQYFAGAKPSTPAADPAVTACEECGGQIPLNSRFCPLCGHQQLVFQRCESCGKNLAPNAKFCSRCGKAVGDALSSWVCEECGSENMPEALFCNQCGKKR